MTASIRPMPFTCPARSLVSAALARSPMTTPAAPGARSRSAAARWRVRACRTTSWPSPMRTPAAARPRPSVEPVMKIRDTGSLFRRAAWAECRAAAELLARAVTRVAQHPAQVDDHLGIDVLAGRRVEEFKLRPDLDGDLPVVANGHRADGFQQRHHRMPFDVVAHRMLEDLAQRVSVTMAEVRWPSRRDRKS